MKLIKRYLFSIVLLTILLFSSCGKSKEKILEEKKNKEKEYLKALNIKAVEDLTKKYNSISDWENLGNYTYAYQELFIDEKKPMSFEGNLMDISKSDTTYFLKLRYVDRLGFRFINKQHYIALISITPGKFSGLRKLLKSKIYKMQGCFIFNVTKISSFSPEVNSDIESSNEDPESYLTYNFDETLIIFKGDLIDYYLIKTPD